MKNQFYIRKGRKYLPEEIFPYVLPSLGNKKQKVDFDGDMIKVTSDRLVAFKISLACATCGLKGSFFVKERSPQTKVFHFNLYAINDQGEEILMTKDHIIPKSKGGKNNPKNYQTMCRICNAEKKDIIGDHCETRKAT